MSAMGLSDTNSRQHRIARPDGTRGATSNILVVDDERLVAQALAALLRAQGHRTQVSHSGQQTLAILAKAEKLYDLIILDVAMPGMSGLEVLRHLRQIERLDMAVIMYSAFCDDETRREAMRLDAADYVIKNGNWPDLLRRVANVLDQRAPSSGI